MTTGRSGRGPPRVKVRAQVSAGPSARRAAARSPSYPTIVAAQRFTRDTGFPDLLDRYLTGRAHGRVQSVDIPTRTTTPGLTTVTDGQR